MYKQSYLLYSILYRGVGTPRGVAWVAVGGGGGGGPGVLVFPFCEIFF